MEPSDGSYFKHIPVHFYRSGSSVMTQTLVKPVSDDGNNITLGELIKLNYPSVENRKFVYIIEKLVSILKICLQLKFLLMVYAYLMKRQFNG